MKTVLATLSLITGSIGVFLLVMFLVASAPPAVVFALGIGMLIQAGYTLAYLSGRLAGFEPWAQRLLIAGQTMALLVGSFGFLSSILYNVAPPGGDYEYGPLTVGALIAIQAATALWMHAFRSPRPEPVG